MRFVGGAGSGPGNFLPGSNAPVVPVPLPRPANAPNMVNFTGVPQGMEGNQYYGEGLSQIESQRQALAQAAGFPLAAVKEPFGGAAYALDKLGTNLRDMQAVAAEKATRERLAAIMGGINLDTGPTAEQIQAAYDADPAFGEKLYAQAIAARGKEHWVELPDGRQQNTVTGEIKDAGTNAGGAKLSDISSAIGHIESLPSYKNMAQASPIWSSILKAGDNAQGDLNVILGMAKLFDPGSVVRDKEGETVVQTAGLPSEIFSAWKYLTGQPGSRLNAYDPGLRDKLLAEGYTRMQGYNDAWQRDQKQWREFAGRHNIDPRDLLLDSFPELAPYEAKTPDTGDGGGSGGGGGGGGGDPANPAPDQPPNEVWPPKVGDVVTGKGGKKYTFKGGDPYDKKSYEPYVPPVVVPPPAGGGTVHG